MSAPRQSRYHVYRTSSTKTLLIADSQARNLEAGNLNILSLPGACVRHVYNFIPPKDNFDIIVLFVGGNDLYFFKNPTTTPALQVAHEITDLANLFCDRAKVVYVLGIPERNENKVRSKQVNDFLQSVGERKTKDQPLVTWRYRTVARYITGACYFHPHDATHLNENGLNNLRNLNKEKILYKTYKKELNKRGYDKFFECKRDECQFPCSDW